MAGMRVHRPGPPDEPLSVMRWWLVTTVTVVVVLSGGALAMWLLDVWTPVPARVPNPDELRLDRIRTGLTVAAGLAAGVTLLMTLRRQALSERAQRFAESAQRFAQSDALEQRITALYVAAAEQLGNDKAAVRLAGLYALDRLGQDHPKLRQTVFDVWCAYLRMPYKPPRDALRRTAQWPPEHAQARQELEVRLTAQRLLTRHLRRGSGDADEATYWLRDDDALSIDLVGAELVDFTADGCWIGRADFSGARFHGSTNLRGVRFCRRTMMANAQFHGDVDLSYADFRGRAELGNATDHDKVVLQLARFSGNVDLYRAEFLGAVRLDDTAFEGGADLRRTRFHGYANLDKASIRPLTGAVDLEGALATSATGLPESWQLAPAPPTAGGLRPVTRKASAP